MSETEMLLSKLSNDFAKNAGAMGVDFLLITHKDGKVHIDKAGEYFNAESIHPADSQDEQHAKNSVPAFVTFGEFLEFVNKTIALGTRYFFPFRTAENGIWSIYRKYNDCEVEIAYQKNPMSYTIPQMMISFTGTFVEIDNCDDKGDPIYSKNTAHIIDPDTRMIFLEGENRFPSPLINESGMWQYLLGAEKGNIVRAALTDLSIHTSLTR